MSDLISRCDAIDALQKEINKGIPPFDDVMGSIRCGVRLARNIIEDLPSAEPPTKCVAEIRFDKEDLEALVAEKVEEIIETMSGKWTPCSERPPKKPGSYICTCSDGAPYPKVTVIKFHPRTKAWELNGTRAYWKVRAWMPLPEPWKGDSK